MVLLIIMFMMSNDNSEKEKTEIYLVTVVQLPSRSVEKYYVLRSVKSKPQSLFVE